MKKLWDVPGVVSIDISNTANDTVYGSGGDNIVWIYGDDGCLIEGHDWFDLYGS